MDQAAEGFDAAADRGESFLYDIFHAPENWLGQIDGRRRDAAADCKTFPHETFGSPIGHGDQAAGADHAGEFPGDDIRARREHGAVHGNDYVEGRVGKLQHFRVAILKVGVQIFGRGAGARLRQQIFGNVDAGDARADARGGDGEITGATGHVENVHAGANRQAGDEGNAFFGGVFCDLAKISGRPGRLQALLDAFEGGGVMSCGSGRRGAFRLITHAKTVSRLHHAAATADATDVVGEPIR